MNQIDLTNSRQPLQVVLVQPRRRWVFLLLLLLLGGSFCLNLLLAVVCADYVKDQTPPNEKFHSGEVLAKDKIARIVTDFTIMPPHTKRFLDTIDHIQKQDDVKGVVLVIDSPGGLVSDSHEIYYRLKKLSETKPISVSMKGIAASGGYYIAMGAGAGAPIYAEPTTWTGSIGVIMPRYDISKLADQYGVKSDSLTTGPLKDTLNPFKELTEEDRKVWMEILDDSFKRFLTVIDEGRENLTMEQIRALATGQIYTSGQAIANGLVDKIGYEDDVIKDLKEKLGLTSVRVVNYEHPKSFAESLLGAEALNPPVDPLSQLINASVPRAMYLFGGPGTSGRSN